MREKSASNVRVMTWNIHGTVGGNPRFSLLGVVDLIRRWDPDIVALQEVDSRRKTTADNPFEFLQEIKACSLHLQGLSDATVVHNEGWQFMQVGKYLERADKTTRIWETPTRRRPPNSSPNVSISRFQ